MQRDIRKDKFSIIRVSPKIKKRSYWCVAVHVAAAADGGVQVVKVDGRQALL